MSVNAIVAGCNQKNNREPLTSYDDIDVEQALDQLRTLGVVSELDWVGRVSKYKHGAYEWLGVSRPELAVLAELLLRGAQPLGDLRARAARMEPIADQAALKPIVDALLARGLMIELTPAGRGQVVSHNLYTPSELEEVRAGHGGRATRADAASSQAMPAPSLRAAAAAGADRITELAAEVAALRAQVTNLRERLDALESAKG
jgi:uncharacterized protein YceH (UPF0502 family)